MEIEDIINVKPNIHQDDEILDFVYDFITICGKKLSYDEINKGFSILKQKHKVCPSKSHIRNIYNIHYKELETNNEFKRWLIKRVSRSESGVIVVTIVTKPGDNIKFSCPEKCAYCPTETNLNGVPTQPKSYISTEPAMMRATRCDFNIRQQIIDRLKAYVYTGNIKPDNNKKKIEVILSGGTWDVMPKIYRDQVINEIYWTLNTLGIQRSMLSLEEEIKINQDSIFGLIGLTLETRPDYINKTAIKQYLEYGATRIQIGIQHLDENILKKIERGCTTEDAIKAIRLLKGVGLKVVVHIMPDLPDSSKEKDLKMFERLVSDAELQFDDIKIYPTAVIKSASTDLIVTSKINDWYNDGSYKPYAEANINDLIDVCIYYKINVHPSVRIQRLIRDIPRQSIEVGYQGKSNLRQIILDKFKLENIKCNCIRCHEIKNNFDSKYLKLVVRKFIASQGIEYFITYETEEQYWTLKYISYLALSFVYKLFNKKLYYSGDIKNYKYLAGFLRLRIDPTPGFDFVPELYNSSLIREVHVYGMSSNVGTSNGISSQHKGLGTKLIKVAEEITKSHGLNKVSIIAGIGAREYYKTKLGYCLEKYYMTKNI
jgi:ELP3 family radical SAM enzyme/protein acetyltransferase